MGSQANGTIILLTCLIACGCRTNQPVDQLDPGHGHVTQQVHDNGAVAADHPIASQVGVSVLRQGGNAVDSAVATSFCLAVVRPFSCGLGGGGFMVVWDPSTQEAHALNYRETSPAVVGYDYYTDDALDSIKHPVARYGVHATGTPGTVAGLLAAHERLGSLPLDDLLAPAVELAMNGFVVDASYVAAAAHVGEIRRRYPSLESASQWVWENLCDSGLIKVGDTVRQPALGETLRTIARGGLGAWQAGPCMEIADYMKVNEGPLAAADMLSYSPRWLEPIIVEDILDGYTLLAMPPPSSGGIAMAQVLQIFDSLIEEYELDDHESDAYIHLLAESMKHAFADRAEHLADDAFEPVPRDRLLSVEYIDSLRSSIDPSLTKDPMQYGSIMPPPDDEGTSHLSVIDRNGMAVACTETINSAFGSLVAVPSCGIILNNQMDDFTTVPGTANMYGLRQSDRNLPAAGKRPLSSMSPTILLHDGRVAMIAGASGGPRIITGTTQVILNILKGRMEPVEAVARPRFHHQWMPERLYLEADLESTELIRLLRERGHEVTRRDSVGTVQVIAIDDDGIKPASDPRKGGQPAGY